MDDPMLFRRKDLRMSRMSSLKNATEMVTCLIDAGYYNKDVLSPEFVMSEIQRYSDEFIKFIYSGMEFEGELETKESIASTNSSSPSKLVCAKCKKEINEIVAKFCKQREIRFKGKIYCRSCQNLI